MKPPLFLLCLLLATAPFAAAEEPEGATRVTVPVARDRARLLQNVYTASLEMLHDRYFREEKAILPARALEDVFAAVAKSSHADARWIAVNTKAMSVHHEPKSEFEKQAAAQIAKGAEQVERIEKGVYERATPIALGANCIQCHTGFFADPPKSPRYAALVIRIKLDQE